MKYIYLSFVSISSILIMLRSIVYLQLDGYRYRIKGGLRRELIISVMLFLVANILSTFAILYRKYISVLSSVNLICLMIATLILMLRQYKIRVNITNRLKRMLTLFLVNNCLLYTILLLISVYSRINDYIYIVINGYYLFNHFILYLTHVELLPFENKRNQRYIESAKSILQKHPNISVIGITGSYGKTSVKNILTTILREKYKTFCTPKNYNTPLGIALSIRELEGDEDYFVVELGARHRGDIRELSDIVHPKYGIITGVLEQHLETFKDIKTIEKTKYELYESIPNDGICVFNGHDDVAYKMYNYSLSLNSLLTYSDDIRVEDIVTSPSGSDFTLYLYGDSVKCHTRLIGKHNIDNILMASTLAYKLGVNIEEIAQGIDKIEPIPHRLEVKKENGITIIDDAYNANIKGVKSAIDTLNLFDGRKIVATQGIVEGGRKSRELNREIGVYMADVADIVIVIGKYGHMVYEGLMESNFRLSNVFVARNLKDAKLIFSELLRQGDTLLITNDLPDNY